MGCQQNMLDNPTSAAMALKMINIANPDVHVKIQPKFSKSDDFTQVYAIIIHDLFWYQNLPKTNL